MKDFETLKMFLELKGATDVKENHDKKYDLSFTLNNRQYTMEIKHDHMWESTGNVAIEFFSRGKHSGIATSTAFMWVYILNDELWVAQTDSLKGKLENGRFRQVTGGDNGTSALYLVPIKEFKRIFRRIDS